MGKYTIRKRLASVVIGVATVASLSGAAVLIPTVASADAISDLQAQIAALTAQLAALSGAPAAPASMGACSFTRSLTVGVRGDDVKCLQESLISAGHLAAGLNTGYFGNLTKAAVAKWQAANGVSPAVGYFGSISRAKYASMVVVTPPPPVVPPPPCVGAGCTVPPPPVTGGGLSVVAATQPANSLAPESAVNLPFTKLTLTAGSSDVVVSGITVERVGLGSDSNLSAVVLLDENGTQMDIVKTLGSDHRATVGGTFTVKAGTSKMVTVAGNLAADNSTRAGQVIALSVVAVNTTATVSGTLPITGAQQTINATLDIGTVTMQKGSIDPGSSVSKPVGTTGYTFSSVRVTAGSNEKVYLKSIRWNQTGSAGSGDLANVKTYVDGTAYDVVVSSDGKYYITTFPENGGKGLLMDKGFAKELSIKGDVAGGSGRTIDFDIAKRTDIGLMGETYGYGIKAPQTGSGSTSDNSTFSSGEDPWYDASQVTVQSGTIAVSASNIVPAGNIAVNASNVPLAGFEVEVKGEPISVGQMIFNFLLSNGTAGVASSAGDTTEITNVTLVKDDGTILAGPVDGANVVTKMDGTFTFTSSVTFPVGTTKIKLLGKIGTDFVSGDTFQASTTPSTKWTSVTGQTTGNSITPTPTSAISGLSQTIRAGSFKVTVASSPIAQTVIANSKKFVFANYILDVGASGEDVRVTSLPLAYDEIGAGDPSDLTNCQLWDGATSVTTGSNVVSPTTAASSTNFVFDGNGLILSKGTQKTLALACDVKSGSNSVYYWGLDGAASYTAATGLVSGQTIAETFNDALGQAMTAASGGSMTIALDSGSSGSLSYRLVSPGQTVDLVKIRFNATNEDINLKRVALQLSSTASNTPIDLSGQMVTLWDGTTQVGDAVFDTTSDTATSTLTQDVVIPKGSSKIITVKGTVNALTTSGPLTRSGDLLIVDLDANNASSTNGTYGVGVQSGSTIVSSSAVADTTSNGVRIMKAYPELAYEALSSSERTLVSGDARTMYKFKVTAKNGDVALYKMSFRVSSTTAGSSNATTTKFGLYAFTDSGYSTPDSNFSGTNNAGGLINAGNCYNGLSANSLAANNTGDDIAAASIVEIYPGTTGCGAGTTTLTIPSGESRWFKLVGSIGTLAPSGTTDNIQVQMEGDAAAATSATELLQATIADTGMAIANNDFIWSPRSTTTTAALLDADFTNGYGVIGLPSTNMTVETLSK